MNEDTNMTGPRTGRHGLRSRAVAWLELVRLPNLFTAMADSAMGFLFVQEVASPTDGAVLGLLVAASTALYAAGVVLNDLFDLEADARDRPERPLPSGRIAPDAARAMGWGLLALGLALAWSAAVLTGQNGPGLVACVLAGTIVFYDTVLKRTPLGPLAMGACRMLNVLLGMSVAGGAWSAAHWAVAGGIGIYVAGVTWFARTEARLSDHRQLALATVLMLAGVALLASFPLWIDEQQLLPLLQIQPQRWYLFMTVLGAWIGWRSLRAIVNPTPDRVQMVVRQCIFSLIFLDAAACLAVRGLGYATLILLLLVPTTLLGRWVYST
jgi:4-hydroxybenzoate polyprenyltransferase